MSVLRSLSKHTRALSHTVPTKPSTARAFHSPFVSLSSPLTTPPPPTSHVSPLYEKQLDHSPDPQVSSAGTRTYVVSEPDPANTPYAVPSGAYPTSAPYQHYAATELPATEGAQYASTSPGLAHPITSRAPQNESGVKESSAVRHSNAPGEMHERGGSAGGLGLMDKAGTRAGSGSLAERNPPPLFEYAEKFAKAGVDNAWKERK
ncbi:hypothetical protein B0H21DRAFT_725515 [Amylocystis lapponica]|nr:hypothetical protein B0H21DRAFT_725515 [Amylocystis lapponica]